MLYRADPFQIRMFQVEFQATGKIASWFRPAPEPEQSRIIGQMLRMLFQQSPADKSVNAVTKSLAEFS